METSKNSFEDFPDWVLEKWQNIADLLAKTINIPSALIMKTENEFMEVFISSHSENNPYKVGGKEKWHGLYCETVIKTQNKLLVTNATKDKFWKKNPDIELGMIAYLGFPLNFPDNQPFGTLCILDNKERPFTLLNEKLILQFKNVIELDLALIQSFELNSIQMGANVVKEIAERKQAEDKLKVSEQLYRNLFNQANEGLILLTLDGKIAELNHSFAQMHGHTVDEMKNMDIKDLDVLRENVFDGRADVMQRILSGEVVRFEVEHYHKNGHSFYLSDTVSLISIAGQQYFLAFHQDITERKKTENELRLAKEKAEESEIKYKQIFDNTFDIMSIYEVTEDRRFKVITFNNAEAKLIGDIENYKDRYIDDCIPPELYTQFKQNYDRCLAEEKLIIYEEDITFLGFSRTFLTQLIPLKNSIGRIHRIIVIARDITDNKLLQTQLINQNEELKLLNIDLTISKKKAEESDRLKTAFLGNMSHEIRTPMNGILGFASLLKEPGLKGEEQQRFIENIESSSARMLDIISEIMEISKIESGHIDIHLQETNINDEIEKVYTSLKPEAETKQINLSFRNSLQSDKALIVTDSEKLFSILNNLVRNAIKYTDIGSIEFGYDKKGEILEFFVSDTGIGIRKERMDAIFERFIQADIADIEARQGAGLGLSIAKAYVEILGGSIWVESEVGKGSIFKFTLPYNREVKVRNG